VRRLLAALAGLLGIAWLRRRRPAVEPPPAADRAEELRTKLAQVREADEARPEDTAPSGGGAAPDVEERRREVHDRARAAIDEMRGGE
jgi:hypothetical protein